jgi:hypothetical protein
MAASGFEPRAQVFPYQRKLGLFFDENRMRNAFDKLAGIQFEPQDTDATDHFLKVLNKDYELSYRSYLQRRMFMVQGRITRLIVVTLLLALVSGRPASAMDFFEIEVYPYETAGAGEKEFESLNSYVINGQREAEPGLVPTHHLWRTSLELSYGLSDHLEVAGYLDLALTADGRFDYAGNRFRGRYRFFEKDQIPVNLGLYAEIEFPNSRFSVNDIEVEIRLILEKDLGPLTIQLNPIFEKAFDGEESSGGVELQYAAKGYYRFRPWLMPGVEFYGDFGPLTHFEPSSEQKHFIFPVVDSKLSQHVKLNTGVGFGLTSASDSVLVKLNLEYEFY